METSLLSKLPWEIISAIVSYLDTTSLWSLCFANKRTFKDCCLEEIHCRWYASRMTIFSGLSRTKWLMRKRRGIWRGICAAAFACLYQKEWTAGSLRLFKVNEECFGQDGLLDNKKDAAAAAMNNHRSALYGSGSNNGIHQNSITSSSLINCTAHPASTSTRDLPPLIPSITSHNTTALADVSNDDQEQLVQELKDTTPPSSRSPLPIRFSSFHNTLFTNNSPNIINTVNHEDDSTLYTRKNTFDGFRALSKAQAMYPNPENEMWGKILSCTMDFRESFKNPPQESMGDCDLFFRYSERMDIGSFLLWVPSPTGNLLFRLKPTGKGSPQSHFGKPGLVLWDSATFGFCNFCQFKLERIQVCGSCRVFQYCSRECQKKDWERDHVRICSIVKFDPYHPNSEDEATNE